MTHLASAWKQAARSGERSLSQVIAKCKAAWSPAVWCFTVAIACIELSEYAIALLFGVLGSIATGIRISKNGTATVRPLVCASCLVIGIFFWTSEKKGDDPWTNLLPKPDLSIEWEPPQGVQRFQFNMSSFAVMHGDQITTVDNALHLEITAGRKTQEIRTLAIEVSCKWSPSWIKLKTIDTTYAQTLFVQGIPSNVSAVKIDNPDLRAELEQQPALDARHTVKGWLYTENPETLPCESDDISLRARVGDGAGKVDTFPISLPDPKQTDAMSKWASFSVGSRVDISHARWGRLP